MLQDLAALLPPVIVCVAFVIGAWVIVRKELAPSRRRRAEAAPPDHAPPAAVRSARDQDAS
jgi:hypothetical protein